jgi:hypothetical protein
MVFECLEPRYTMNAALATEVPAPDLTPTDSLASELLDAFIRSDVNRDGAITPLDALIVINDLNQNGVRAFIDDRTADHALDVNADSQISPADVLAVISDIEHIRRDPPIVTDAGTAVVYEDPSFGTVALPLGQELAIRSRTFWDRFHTLILTSATTGFAITGVSDTFQFAEIEVVRDPNGACNTVCTEMGWFDPADKEWFGELDTVAVKSDGTVAPIRLHFYGVRALWGS